MLRYVTTYVLVFHSVYFTYSFIGNYGSDLRELAQEILHEYYESFLMNTYH